MDDGLASNYENSDTREIRGRRVQPCCLTVYLHGQTGRASERPRLRYILPASHTHVAPLPARRSSSSCPTTQRGPLGLRLRRSPRLDQTRQEMLSLKRRIRRPRVPARHQSARGTLQQHPQPLRRNRNLRRRARGHGGRCSRCWDTRGRTGVRSASGGGSCNTSRLSCSP